MTVEDRGDACLVERGLGARGDRRGQRERSRHEAPGEVRGRAHHARMESITWAGSTPVRRWSRPWNLWVNLA